MDYHPFFLAFHVISLFHLRRAPKLDLNLGSILNCNPKLFQLFDVDILNIVAISLCIDCTYSLCTIELDAQYCKLKQR